MKKRYPFLLALLFVLLFALGACTPPSPSPVTPTPPDDITNEPVPSEGLWNTDDVDISHIRSERLIAFTFDDGPVAETEALLKVFEEYNKANPDFIAHATLFIMGDKVKESDKAVLQRAFDGGMELGNHSFSHANLTTLTEENILEEIDRTDSILKEIDGKERHLFRPPGGHSDERVLALAKAPFINWTGDLDTSDWTGVSENEIYNKITTNILDGGIVLMHQGYPETVKAVERLLPDLKERGFQVVSVSELAKAYEIKMYTGQVYSYLG